MEKRSRKQVLPLSEPARNFGTRGISALIAPVVRPAFRTRAPAAYQILADWDMLAGPEVSAVARPVKLAGGTLTLACSGAAAMELQYRGALLISRLNTGLGGAKIERLRFTQDAPSVPAAVIKKPESAPQAPPVELPEGPLGAALGTLFQSMGKRRE